MMTPPKTKAPGRGLRLPVQLASLVRARAARLTDRRESMASVHTPHCIEQAADQYRALALVLCSPPLTSFPDPESLASLARILCRDAACPLHGASSAGRRRGSIRELRPRPPCVSAHTSGPCVPTWAFLPLPAGTSTPGAA